MLLIVNSFTSSPKLFTWCSYPIDSIVITLVLLLTIVTLVDRTIEFMCEILLLCVLRPKTRDGLLLLAMCSNRQTVSPIAKDYLFVFPSAFAKGCFYIRAVTIAFDQRRINMYQNYTRSIHQRHWSLQKEFTWQTCFEKKEISHTLQKIYELNYRQFGKLPAHGVWSLLVGFYMSSLLIRIMIWVWYGQVE